MQKTDWNSVKKTRDYLINELEKIGGRINGSKEKRLPNNINVYFTGADAEMLVIALSQRGIMCSTRGAYTSKKHSEHKVLHALGLSEKEADGTIRLSLSPKTTKNEIDAFLKELKGLQRAD